MNIVVGIIGAILALIIIQQLVVYYQKYSNSTCTAKVTPEISATTTAQKAAFFKFSIVICIVYGCLLLLILGLSYISVAANNIFLVNYKPFTLTFAGGIIFVLIVLIWQLLTYKDAKKVVSPYDSDLCPEFWKLAPTPTNSPLYQNVQKNQPGYAQLFSTQCVPDTNILQTYRPLINPTTKTPMIDTAYNNANINPYGQRIVNPGQQNQYVAVDASAPAQATNMGANLNTTVLNNILGKMNNLTNNGAPGIVNSGNAGPNKLVCDQLYPQYLNSLNNNDPNATGPNTYACTYAQACGIPWASLCGQ